MKAWNIAYKYFSLNVEEIAPSAPPKPNWAGLFSLEELASVGVTYADFKAGR